MTSIKLSVIVPCYNEELRFADGFDHYFSYFKKQKYAWELIFVNDGSTDGTLNQMRQSAKRGRNIEIISYSQNRGKGYAIVQGVKAARGQAILFSDLDHSVSAATIEDFLPYFKKGYEVAIGSRRVKGAKILVHQHPVREFLGRGFSQLVAILIDWRIKDATCGFKVFEKDVAKIIFPKITIYDWAFDAEILFLIKRYNFKLAQVPVSWRNVGGSRVSLKRDVSRSLLGLLKIRLRDFQGKYS